MSHQPKTTKSGTTAERVTWMSRTSDVLGSHVKTDLESYLTLIRRKIQEKCSTTAELIGQIRRFKIGESAHVTPNEFRFTLIKFGVILPQVLVDRIFNVFDSDRSGTMDFDEFATWIMNSEFRPAVTNGAAKLAAMESPEMQLQKKLKHCVDTFPRVFKDLKQQVSFLEFISEVNRANMPLTEREARNIFQILDPKDEGYVESSAIVIWATTGRLDKLSSPKAREEAHLHAMANEITDVASLRRLIKKVIGNNTRQLENAFAHIKLGQGTKLPFEEFRRCCLNGGVGKNMNDLKQLFLALGGRNGGGSHGGGEGLADVDLFFANLAPVPVDPSTEVSIKRAPTTMMSTSRADRHLRDALRKCFKEVKAEIEAEDRSSEGFVSPESLYRILVKRAMPLSFEDFRFVIQQIRKEKGSNRIDYHHFLHSYNPTLPHHHQLKGLSTLRDYETAGEVPLPGGLAFPKERKGGSGGGGEAAAASTALSSSSSSSSVLVPSLSLSASAVPLAAAAAARLHASHEKKATASQAMDDSRIGMTSSSPSSSPSPTVGMASNPELRRIWQSVLRECHRLDPERTGQVNRHAFIAALESAGGPMTPEGMNQLADQYTLSNGLVNYLLLFRSYLTNSTTTRHGATPAMLSPAHPAQRSTTAQPFTRVRSLPALMGGAAPAHAAPSALNHTYSVPAGPVHPWEFGYTRDKHPEHPYWHNATALPKNTAATTQAMKVSMIPSAAEKSAEELSDQEKSLLLSQYNNMVLQLCHKCYKLFLPSWRTLRSNLKKQQVGGSQKGTILTSHFITILEAEGILLTKTELGLIVKNFRGYGTQDLVRFDDFLRVCMLVKDHFK